MIDPNFPHLSADNRRVTSPATPEYNCLAWAGGESHRWWQPGEGFYWPTPADPDAMDLTDLIAAFAAVGFIPCSSGEWESGVEKIALYADSTGEYTHAARQLPDGKWTSKLGQGEDIEHHTPDDLAGGVYGNVAAFMQRPVPLS